PPRRGPARKGRLPPGRASAVPSAWPACSRISPPTPPPCASPPIPSPAARPKCTFRASLVVFIFRERGVLPNRFGRTPQPLNRRRASLPALAEAPAPALHTSQPHGALRTCEGHGGCAARALSCAHACRPAASYLAALTYRRWRGCPSSRGAFSLQVTITRRGRTESMVRKR